MSLAPARLAPVWASPRWLVGELLAGIDGSAVCVVGGEPVVGGELLWALRASPAPAAPSVREEHRPPSRIEGIVALDARRLLCATAAGDLIRYSAAGGFEPEPGPAARLGLSRDAHPGWRLIGGRSATGAAWVAALTRDRRVAYAAGGDDADDGWAARLEGGIVVADGAWLAELTPGRGLRLSSDRGQTFARVAGCETATAICLSERERRLWLATFASGPRIELMSIRLDDLVWERLAELRPPRGAGLDDEPHVRALAWDAERRGLWLTGAFGVGFAAAGGG
jgi:hypothetical protein